MPGVYVHAGGEMFTDARELHGEDAVEADICIVGGGAAGISLAQEFIGSSTRVVLLESGGMSAAPGDRGVYQVVPAKCPTLGSDTSKPWYFGGNTNYWFGNCRPLDALDFTPRDWIPHSGWPFGHDELRPFYERAQAVSGLGDFRWYDVEACRDLLEHAPRYEDVLDTKILQRCPVLSFSDLYRDRLTSSENVRVILGARAMRLEPDGSGRVSRLRAVDRDGGRLSVDADTFVLAAGGVENARLLLCSDGADGCRLGNEHDLVGRFFMEHWYFTIGLGDWTNGDLGLYDHELQRVGNADLCAQLALPEEVMRGERLPGMSFFFVRTPPDSPSVAGLRRLAKSAIGRARTDSRVTDLRLSMTDPLEVSRHLVRKIRRRDASTDRYALRLQFEQTPDPENRIRLGQSRDRFGQPEMQLELDLAPDDRVRHTRAVQLAVDPLGVDARRIARQFRLLLDSGRFGFFWHHMGTTRMHVDPAQGVVDVNCRLHGVENVFVAGCSVFPTSGTATPTLTIVALALRLADHLRARSARVEAT